MKKIVIFLFIISLFNVSSLALANSNASRHQSYVPGEILIKYKKANINLHSLEGRKKAENLNKQKSLTLEEHIQDSNISLSKINDNRNVEDVINQIKNDPNIEYAEPNYTRDISTISSNDTDKGLLWGLDNTGQTINGDWGNITGTTNADINAPEAWAINEGTNASVNIAVIDIGVLYTHPDLLVNMWDGTNCLSDTGSALGGCSHGYDYQSNDKIPLPSTNSDLHGTHVSGIIGAVKDNNLGVIGIAPHSKIMALKFALTVSSEVKAIDFAIQNGAKVINASFGGAGFSQAEYDAISRFQTAGGIFVAAAGNDGTSNDTTHFYPSDYDLSNIISVAATDQNDNLTSFSNFGATSVDVAAPGENILSTITQNNYDYLSGTSMATPYVSGLAGLIWGYKNNLSAVEVKNIILNSGDTKPSLIGKIVSEKRINAQKSLFDADIFSAQDLHDSAVEGIDPGQHTVGSKVTFQSAIDSANLVLGNASSTSIDISTGVTNLDSSVSTFTSAIVPADFSALNAEILSAQTLHDNAVESTTPGDYIIGSKLILQNAIDTASALPLSATQMQIDNTLITLISSVSTFSSSVVPLSNLSALSSVITSAQVLHDNVVEGILPGQYAVDSKIVLQNAIDTASVIVNTLPQATVDTALTILNTAITNFENGRVKSVITATSDTNGTINPAGTVSVVYGNNQTFTFTPNNNYSVDKVLVDSISVGKVSSYQFSNVIINHTIAVSFKRNSSGGGGGGGGGSTIETPPVIDTPPVVPIVVPISPVVPPAQDLPRFLTNSNYVFLHNLSFGMTDPDIKLLQIYLNTHGYPVSTTGLGSTGNETTKFGSLTKQAVIKFQLAHHIDPIGIVGPKTRGEMNK
ncbi:MAG: S8 family serine peptidase [Candidatus Nomurabacteria bacterium]|nr:S8 family serine peptidase [Candidatus Nomurabacteria bacterium]